jgi:hypothetical protein
MKMTDERWEQLMNPKGSDATTQLTPEEIAEGWHFCWDFDCLLRNNNEDRDYQCDCLNPKGDE